MKRIELKRVMFWLLILLSFIGIITVLKKLDQDFINSCMSNGYSKEYCEIHK